MQLNKSLQHVIKEYPDGTIDVVSNGRIGRYCFFPFEIEKHYRLRGQSLPKELIILDVGCGGAADHPLMHDYFDRRGIELILIGIDVNEQMLDLTRKGKVSYPLEIELIADESGKLHFFGGDEVTSKNLRAYLPTSVTHYFKKCIPKNGDGILHLEKFIDDHICEKNPAPSRWVMKPECRERLDLRAIDAVSMPFSDCFADVIIAENFLFGFQGGVYRRIREEITRVIKPDGLYLGNGR